MKPCHTILKAAWIATLADHQFAMPLLLSLLSTGPKVATALLSDALGLATSAAFGEMMVGMAMYQHVVSEFYYKLI